MYERHSAVRRMQRLCKLKIHLSQPCTSDWIWKRWIIQPSILFTDSGAFILSVLLFQLSGSSRRAKWELETCQVARWRPLVSCAGKYVHIDQTKTWKWRKKAGTVVWTTVDIQRSFTFGNCIIRSKTWHCTLPCCGKEYEFLRGKGCIVRHGIG